MKPYRVTILASAFLLATLPQIGCDNSIDGGSGPSGSYLRIVRIEPQKLDVDLFEGCGASEDGGPNYNPGTNHTAVVTVRNESAPNAPEKTNSYVTLSRYRVDFTGLDRTVSIPSIDGPAATTGVDADSSAAITVLVMNVGTQEYIRSHYPQIGNGQSLTLRATITIWGEDAFKVTVSTKAEMTIVVDDYDPC